MSARNRELLALVPVAVIVAAGFAAVFIVKDKEVSNVSLTYAGYFLGLCLAAHIFLRIRLPYADPYLFPLCALLAAIGLVVIYRIDDKLAFDQASVFVLGLALFCLTILFLRDYHVLERYRYLIATAGILLLLAPFITRHAVNGAYLSVDIGPIKFQPAELAKICIVIFLASYLAEKREMLSVAARRVLGLTIPPLKHFGPLLVVWGAAMLMLVFIKDLGSSLMFFGAFLALLYVATGRFSYVLIGLVIFAIGAYAIGSSIAHVHDRFEIWLDPFAKPEPVGAGQVQQSLFAQADGGLFGQGLGESLLKLPGPFAPHCHQPFPDCGSILPAPHTDFIYAVITMELGLFGACGLILIYALIAARGFKTAVMAPDAFSKLLATGLTAVFALQAFVIIGGVTKVIPLTGVTLPFVSFGGSSIVANMILLALLLLISDRARRPPSEPIDNDPIEVAGLPGVNTPIIRVYGLVLVLFALLVYFTSKWAVFDADALQDRSQNRRPLIEEQQVPRGTITTADGVLIAKSDPEGGGNHPVYVRNYPQGPLFGNPVGYSFVTAGRTGIEQSENDLLAGEKNEFASIIDQLANNPQEGADITLTLDAGAQQLAIDQLQSAIANTAGASGAGGSVVAIEPSTGAVKVMASVPGYDPNDAKDPDVLSRLSEEGTAGPLFNRPTQATYEPGSTMKVVTASAALDSGEFTPDTTLSGQTGLEIDGVPLENAGGETFGEIDMDFALTHSVNTYFAQVGEKLGTETMFEYMDRFGFFHDPELDFPDDQMAPSGVYDSGKLLGSGDAIDIGRVAIGQERLLVTPMQMAEVAATIANDGKLMKPTFLQSAKDPDGRTIQELDPSEQSDVVSSETADQVTEMMTHVTEEGTAAGLTVGGIPFAGKTGTAEVDVENGINRPWFIGFAPAADPQIAVAVMLERCQGCFGGEVAGPIATQVMESLLN